MAGSYLLYNELHFNGLMTDLGYNFSLISSFWAIKAAPNISSGAALYDCVEYTTKHQLNIQIKSD